MAQRAVAVRLEVTGSAEATAKVEALGTAISNSIGLRAETAAARGAAAFKKWEASIDTAVRAQQKLAAEESRAASFVAAGHVGQERANELLAMQASRLAGLSRGVQTATGNVVEFNRSVGVTSNHMRQLAPQINDIATQLALGQSPFLILAAQGGQVTQIFGGIGPTMRAAVDAIGPVRIAATALAGGLALAVGHASGLAQEARTLNVALIGTGRSAELSTTQLHGYISALKQSGVATADARAIAGTLARTQGLSAANAGRIAASAPDLAAALGTDATAAAAALTKVATDGVAGIKALDDQLNFLTADQLKAIRGMIELGDRTGATKAAFDALQLQIGGLHEKGLSPLAKSLEEAKNGWTSFMEAVANSSVTQGLLTALGVTLSGLGSVIGMTGPTSDAGVGNIGREISETERRILDLRANFRRRFGDEAVPPEALTGGLESRLADLRRRYQSLDWGAQAGGPSTTDSERERRAKQLQDATREFTEEERIARLGKVARERAARLSELNRAAGGMNFGTPDDRDAYVGAGMRAFDAKVGAARGDEIAAIRLQTEAMKALVLAGNESEASARRQEARSQALKESYEKGGVAVDALTDSLINQAAWTNAADFQKQLAALGQLAQSADRLANAEGQGPRASRLAELDEKVRSLTHYLEIDRNIATDPEVISTINAQIEATKILVGHTDDLTDRRKAIQAIAEQDRTLEMLRAEAGLLGESVETRDRELSILKERQKIIASGVDINSAENQRRLSLAGQIADETNALRRQQDAWNELGNIGTQAFDRIGTSITDAFTKGEISTIRFGDIAKAVMSELVQYGLKASIVNPIINAFGGTRGTIWDLAGAATGFVGGGGASVAGGFLGGGGTWDTGAWGMPANGYAGAPSAAYLAAGGPQYGITGAIGGASGAFQNIVSAGGPGLLGYLGLAGNGASLAGGGSLLESLGITGSDGLLTSLGLTGPKGLLSGISTFLNTPIFSSAGDAAGGFTSGGIAASGGTIGQALGGAAGILGGGYGIYSGIQKGGIGGAAGALGGAVGLASGAGSLLGALGVGGLSLGPAGWIASAILSIAGALLPGQKPSNRGQTALYDFAADRMASPAPHAREFSQANLDAAKSLTDTIVDIGTRLERTIGLDFRQTVGFHVGDRDGLSYLIDGRRGPMDPRTEEGISKASTELVRQMVQESANFLPDQALRHPLMVGVNWENLEGALKQIEDLYTATNRGRPTSNQNIATSNINWADFAGGLAELTWVKDVYEVMAQGTTAGEKFARQIEELNAGFDLAAEKARDLGLAEDIVARARARDVQAAYDTRDLAGLQLIQRQQGTLTDFLDQMDLTRGSPQSRLTAAQSAFDLALGRARGKDITTADLSAVTQSAGNLLSASSAYYATGSGNAEIENFLRSTIANLGAQLDLPAFGGSLERSMSAAVNPLKTEMELLRDAVTDLREELRTSRLRDAA